MSAWPEAVWIKQEIEKALNMSNILLDLQTRLTAIENRYLIVATSQNDQPAGISFIPDENSLWFKIKN